VLGWSRESLLDLDADELDAWLAEARWVMENGWGGVIVSG
jgi:hypothetical protein